MHKRRACHGARSAPWSAHSVVKHAQKSVCTNYEVPTGNLDTASGHDVMGLLKVAAKQFQQTVVLITHDNDIAQMADRIVHIEDGRIVKAGDLYAGK